jgi:hypothetical protein
MPCICLFRSVLGFLIVIGAGVLSAADLPYSDQEDPRASRAITRAQLSPASQASR